MACRGDAFFSQQDASSRLDDLGHVPKRRARHFSIFLSTERFLKSVQFTFSLRAIDRLPLLKFRAHQTHRTFSLGPNRSTPPPRATDLGLTIASLIHGVRSHSAPRCSR